MHIVEWLGGQDAVLEFLIQFEKWCSVVCDRHITIRRKLLNEEQRTPAAMKLNLQNKQILRLENVATFLSCTGIIQMERQFPA